MMEQFNNLDVSNLDECPAEETFDETIRTLSASLSPLQDVDPVVSRLTHVRPEQPGVAVQFGFWHHLSEAGEILPELISIHSNPRLLLIAVRLWEQTHDITFSSTQTSNQKPFISLPVWLDQNTNRRLQGGLRTWDNFLSSSHKKHGSETQTSDKETAEFQYYCNFPPIMSEEEKIWHHTEDLEWSLILLRVQTRLSQTHCCSAVNISVQITNRNESLLDRK